MSSKASVPRKKKTFVQMVNTPGVAGYVFILPFIIGFAAFLALPMLTPTIFFNLINQLINGFMAFTQSYIITQGKPRDSTLFYTVYMYQNSFTYSKLGYGCAMAWFMVFIVGLLTFILFKTQNKWVYYES